MLQIISQLEEQAVKAEICSAVQLDAVRYFKEHEAETAEITMDTGSISVITVSRVENLCFMQFETQE